MVSTTSLSWEQLVASMGEGKARQLLRQWETMCALSEELAAMTALEDRWDFIRSIADTNPDLSRRALR